MIKFFSAFTLFMIFFLHGAAAQETLTQIPEYEVLLKNKNFTKVIELLSASKTKLDYLGEYYLGLAYFKVEDDANTQLHLSASVKMNPNFFRSHDYLAGSYFFSGKLTEADAEYNICVKLDNSYARGYYMLGQIYEKTSRGTKALESFKTAARLDAADENYSYKVGYVLYGQGDFDRAIPYFLAASKVNPINYSAVSLLMESYFRSGKPDLGQTLKPVLAKIRQNSTDKRLKDLKSFQFDEFSHKGYRLVASEIFEPTSDLYYFWSFAVYDGSGKLVKSINLESSGVIREQGMPYIVGVDEFSQGSRKHRTTNIGFKELPKYEVIKELVFKEIDQGLGEGAMGVYGVK